VIRFPFSLFSETDRRVSQFWPLFHVINRLSLAFLLLTLRLDSPFRAASGSCDSKKLALWRISVSERQTRLILRAVV
jgi:hypothetical protein